MDVRRRNQSAMKRHAAESKEEIKPSSANQSSFSLQWDIVIVLLIMLVNSAVYFNGIEGQFCYDDHFAIKNNKDVTGENDFWDLWNHDFWGQDISKPDSHKSYRPISVISFRVNFWLHRLFFDSQEGGYRRLLIQLHVTNVLFHVVVSCQVYFLCRQLLQLGHTSVDPLSAFLAALMFSLHPVHTEAVQGLVGRAEPLSTMFAILSFQLYQSSAATGSRIALACSLLSLWLAILSKETTFPVIAIIILWDVLQKWDLLGPKLRIMKPSDATNAPFAPFYLRTACMLLLALGYLYLRQHITVHFTVMNYRRVENPIAFASDRLTRALSMIYLHARYAWLLLVPHPLSADYSFDCLPLVSFLLDPRNLAGIALYAIVGATGLIAALNALLRSDTTAREVLIGLSWLILPFIPSSNVLIWVGTMLAERLLYLPSVGFCILLSLILCKTLRSSRTKHLTLFLVLLVCVAFAAKTYSRNQDWLDEQRLFDSAEEVCPSSVKVHYNQGIMAMDRKDYQSAKRHFIRAREIEPMHCETDLQFGLIAWQDSKDPNAAVKHFKDAIGCIYTKAKAVENLHAIYQALTQLFPDNFFYMEQWAQILESVEKIDEAYQHYIQAGIGFEQKLKMEADAIRCFESAVRLRKDQAYLAHLWLGTIKLRKIDFQIAKTEQISAALSHYWAASMSEEYGRYALNGLVDLLSRLNNEQKAYFGAYIQQVSARVRDLGLIES